MPHETPGEPQGHRRPHKRASSSTSAEKMGRELCFKWLFSGVGYGGLGPEWAQNKTREVPSKCAKYMFLFFAVRVVGFWGR